MTEANPLPLRIGAELEGVAISSDAVSFVFLAPKAFPPGQPLSLTLFPGSERELPLQARCIGSKLQPDQRFEVRARLVNLSRETRLSLLAAFGG
jgi:hypothetical protein